VQTAIANKAMSCFGVRLDLISMAIKNRPSGRFFVSSERELILP